MPHAQQFEEMKRFVRFGKDDELLLSELCAHARPRFDGGWGYFSFGDGPGRTKDKAPPAKKAACFDCHRDKAAEDNVFTQFYPVLRAARKK